MKRRVYQTVADKRAWQEPLEPAEAEMEEAIGSRGWYTRGYLPHYDKPGTIQMISYRLADALPASRRREWEGLLHIEDEREQRRQIEEYLDRGHGDCWLKDPRVAGLVEENLLHFDGQRYRLVAWVIMPNHVHVLVELWAMPLGKVVKSWKTYSAAMANRILGRRGDFWQPEYWDRYIRDEQHYRKARHYIEWNPVKAHLVRTPEEWGFGSANPKWQWTGIDRYHDGRLQRTVAQAMGKRHARGRV